MKELGFEEGCLFHYEVQPLSDRYEVKPNEYDEIEYDGDNVENFYVTNFIESYNKLQNNNKNSYYQKFIDALYIFQATHYLESNFGITITVFPDLNSFNFHYKIYGFSSDNNDEHSTKVLFNSENEKNKDSLNKQRNRFMATHDAIDRVLDFLLANDNLVPKKYVLKDPDQFDAMQWNGFSVSSVIKFVGEDNVFIDNKNFDNFQLRVRFENAEWAIVKKDWFIVKKNNKLFEVLTAEEFVQKYK